MALFYLNVLHHCIHLCLLEILNISDKQIDYYYYLLF